MCYGVDMNEEIWKDIPGFEGLYQASNWGRVRSLDRVVKGRWDNDRTIKGKILKPSNRFTLGLVMNGKNYTFYIKHIIALTFIPNYIEGMPITCKDGDEANCKLNNLIIGVNNMCHTGDTSSTIELQITTEIINNTPVVEGGFSEHSRILFDITIADKIDKELSNLRTENIYPNLYNWEEGVDYIDFRTCSNFNNYLPILLELGYSKNSFYQTTHLYIFSERGVAKLMSSLRNDNPAKWEFLNKFVDEYFHMRKELREVRQSDIPSYLIDDEILRAEKWIEERKRLRQAELEAKEAKLLAESLKDENTKVKEKLDKMGIKPPYTINSIQSATRATRTVIVQYMLDNGWVVKRIKDGRKRGFIVINEDYVAQAGEKVWGIHLTPQGTLKLLEVFKVVQPTLW